MINKLLPQSVDNTYRGHKLALWLFALILVVKLFQSLMVVFNTNSTAIYADGFPLGTFSPAAAQTVVALFALSGLRLLIILLLCVLVLVRYRSMISFMYALLVLEYLAGQLLYHFVPLVRVGTPPGVFVNLMLFSLMVIGLVLSLWSQGNHKAKD